MDKNACPSLPDTQVFYIESSFTVTDLTLICKNFYFRCSQVFVITIVAIVMVYIIGESSLAN